MFGAIPAKTSSQRSPENRSRDAAIHVALRAFVSRADVTVRATSGALPGAALLNAVIGFASRVGGLIVAALHPEISRAMTIPAALFTIRITSRPRLARPIEFRRSRDFALHHDEGEHALPHLVRHRVGDQIQAGRSVVNARTPRL